jgi:hypothetical protein
MVINIHRLNNVNQVIRPDGCQPRQDEGLAKKDEGPPIRDGGLSREVGGKSRRNRGRNGASGRP